jgi:hypothetical protein
MAGIWRIGHFATDESAHTERKGGNRMAMSEEYQDFLTRNVRSANTLDLIRYIEEDVKMIRHRMEVGNDRQSFDAASRAKIYATELERRGY